jgi:16S rRNA (cytosine1402-N4)-methyltransferase
MSVHRHSFFCSTGNDQAAASRPEGTAGERGTVGDKYHVPIMGTEVLQHLAVEPFLSAHDGTLGGGGHTRLFLEAGARVLAMDQDWVALARAEELLKPTYGDRLRLWQGDFATLEQKAAGEKFEIMFYDLGLSSRQLEDGARGFSFMREGPLDMRLDQQAGHTAADVVNTWDEERLCRILWDHGEEPAARRIVRAILKRRAVAAIRTTTELAELVATVVQKKGRTHPATRTFQGIRLAVTGELDSLDAVLEQIPRLLNVGGRVGFLTFHSLEDRRVKQWMKRLSTPTIDRLEWPAPRLNPDYCLQLVTRKAVVPSDAEQQANPRSRSCKLRVAALISPAERLSATPRQP